VLIHAEYLSATGRKRGMKQAATPSQNITTPVSSIQAQNRARAAIGTPTTTARQIQRTLMCHPFLFARSPYQRAKTSNKYEITSPTATPTPKTIQTWMLILSLPTRSLDPSWRVRSSPRGYSNTRRALVLGDRLQLGLLRPGCGHALGP